MSVADAASRRVEPFRRAATPFTGKFLLALVVWEAVLSVVYFAATPAEPTVLRYLAYPFIWINAAALAVVTTHPKPANARHRAVGLAVAVPYTLALLWVPGILRVGVPGLTAFTATGGVHVLWSAPGWGPLVTVRTGWLHANLVPFKAVGYLALGYLAYAAVLRASRSALSGLLGLVTCVSCTAPLFGWLAGVLGAGASAVSAGITYGLDLGTLAFLASVAALYYGANRRTRP